MTDHRKSTGRAAPAGRTRAAALALGAAVVGVGMATACGPVGVDTYKAFQSAVEKGDTCADLIDIRSHFHRDSDLQKINADLARIGCTSPTSVRTDR